MYVCAYVKSSMRIYVCMCIHKYVRKSRRAMLYSSGLVVSYGMRINYCRLRALFDEKSEKSREDQAEIVAIYEVTPVVSC